MNKPDNTDYKVIWEMFIADGNKEALGLIYFSHYDLLYSFGLKYTTDNQSIEDAIQNIFSYFLKSASHLSSVNNFKAYLLQSFRHQLINDLKRKNKLKLSNQFSGGFSEYHEPEVDEIYEKEWNGRIGKTISKCLNHLSEKQKEVIFLRFQSELSYNEISVMLDITVDSCYKLVYRSLKEIREELELMHITSKQMILFFMNKF